MNPHKIRWNNSLVLDKKVVCFLASIKELDPYLLSQYQGSNVGWRDSQDDALNILKPPRTH